MTKLQKDGFTLNRYDPFVANTEINGSQCTVWWYVDDTKMSHVEAGVVDEVIAKIKERFGMMVVTRGKKHNLAGMDIVFNDNGNNFLTFVNCVDINMCKISQ